ncbi:diaminobutyrate acetyltransferase [Marinicrinis sediminis]|uniref:L-2,4-diaminobutyric acid acetyltransferase n=1 Tax=Marinicrinis sediminis TaxID=1652465 RepID=A0ABW5R5I7_9BACL
MSHSDIQFRAPRAEDGAKIWGLVKETGVLDVNSPYSYMMLGEFFSDTCAVAEVDGEVAGFVSGFIPPEKEDTLFVWQIAVDNKQQGKGIATSLIEEVVNRPDHHNLQYVEATISPSNQPSTRLFHRLSRQWNTEIQTESCFPADYFPEGQQHEEENMYRVGPISK